MSIDGIRMLVPPEGKPVVRANWTAFVPNGVHVTELHFQPAQLYQPKVFTKEGLRRCPDCLILLPLVSSLHSGHSLEYPRATRFCSQGCQRPFSYNVRDRDVAKHEEICPRRPPRMAADGMTLACPRCGIPGLNWKLFEAHYKLCSGNREDAILNFPIEAVRRGKSCQACPTCNHTITKDYLPEHICGLNGDPAWLGYLDTHIDTSIPLVQWYQQNNLGIGGVPLSDGGIPISDELVEQARHSGLVSLGRTGPQGTKNISQLMVYVDLLSDLVGDTNKKALRKQRLARHHVHQTSTEPGAAENVHHAEASDGHHQDDRGGASIREDQKEMGDGEGEKGQALGDDENSKEDQESDGEWSDEWGDADEDTDGDEDDEEDVECLEDNVHDEDVHDEDVYDEDEFEYENIEESDDGDFDDEWKLRENSLERQRLQLADKIHNGMRSLQTVAEKVDFAGRMMPQARLLSNLTKLHLDDISFTDIRTGPCPGYSWKHARHPCPDNVQHVDLHTGLLKTSGHGGKDGAPRQYRVQLRPNCSTCYTREMELQSWANVGKYNKDGQLLCSRSGCKDLAVGSSTCTEHLERDRMHANERVSRKPRQHAFDDSVYSRGASRKTPRAIIDPAVTSLWLPTCSIMSGRLPQTWESVYKDLLSGQSPDAGPSKTFFIDVEASLVLLPGQSHRQPLPLEIGIVSSSGAIVFNHTIDYHQPIDELVAKEHVNWACNIYGVSSSRSFTNGITPSEAESKLKQLGLHEDAVFVEWSLGSWDLRAFKTVFGTDCKLVPKSSESALVLWGKCGYQGYRNLWSVFGNAFPRDARAHKGHRAALDAEKLFMVTRLLLGHVYGGAA